MVVFRDERLCGRDDASGAGVRCAEMLQIVVVDSRRPQVRRHRAETTCPHDGRRRRSRETGGHASGHQQVLGGVYEVRAQAMRHVPAAACTIEEAYATARPTHTGTCSTVVAAVTTRPLFGIFGWRRGVVVSGVRQ